MYFLMKLLQCMVKRLCKSDNNCKIGATPTLLSKITRPNMTATRPIIKDIFYSVVVFRTGALICSTLFNTRIFRGKGSPTKSYLIGRNQLIATMSKSCHDIIAL